MKTFPVTVSDITALRLALLVQQGEPRSIAAEASRILEEAVRERVPELADLPDTTISTIVGLLLDGEVRSKEHS